MARCTNSGAFDLICKNIMPIAHQHVALEKMPLHALFFIQPERVERQ
jgi:hypothetical protein